MTWLELKLYRDTCIYLYTALSSLQQSTEQMVLQWIPPFYCRVPGNDAADRLGNEGGRLAKETPPGQLF